MKSSRHAGCALIATALAGVGAVLLVGACQATTPDPDTKPSFGGTVERRTWTVGKVIDTVTLPEATGGNGELTYSLGPELPPGLRFDAEARTLGGTPTKAGSYEMTYTAVDADENLSSDDAAALSFTILVQAAEPADTAPRFRGSLSDLTYAVGERIGILTLPEATGGNGELTYSLGPELPPGLRFDAEERTLGGTPTEAGSYEMVYTAVDADENVSGDDAAVLSFTIVVQAAEPADTAPGFRGSLGDRTYVVGERIGTLTLPEATGGNGELTYSLGPRVPPGLRFDAEARTLDGTPTEAGSHEMTYMAVDADENVSGDDAAVLSFTIVVKAAEPADTAPRFRGSLGDRTYVVGERIGTVTLPEATGGNGELSYWLGPRVPPGLRFDPEARTLGGTPREPGSYDMVYTVVDADANAADGDADVLAFAITIQPEERLDAYRGRGDEVFSLNPDGGRLAEARYTLELGDAAAQVYLIATNTAPWRVTPNIERLDAGGASAASRRSSAGRQDRVPRMASESGFHERSWVRELARNLPPATVSPSLHRPQPVNEGDTHIFYDVRDGQDVIEVPATARKVVTDGTTTAIFWIEDDEWGRCGHNFCVHPEMVDTLARRFLRPGAGNDIYDWVTAIFGDPWGPHDLVDTMIPASYADQIHVLLSESARGNYYSSFHTFLSPPSGYSNRRLMVFLRSWPLAQKRRHVWEASDAQRSMLTLAHELQHMIHYYQKEVRHEFRARSASWVDEMNSMMAEEFVAGKLMITGHRGVGHDDPTAARPGEDRSPLGRYNYYNHIELTDPYGWLSGSYDMQYAMGMYLGLTYGGAPLFRDIVQNDRSGTEAVEAAIAARGHPVSFADVLTDWAVANLLSDDTEAPHPYRYNSGTWNVSEAGGVTFRLGSIDLFKYRYWIEGSEYWDGPYFFTIAESNDEGAQPPHSNRYLDLGRNTGTVRLRVDAAEENRITVVVKE